MFVELTFEFKVRASVCVWILVGKVFHTTEVRKKNEWEYCVVHAGTRMSRRGFLWVWEARDETNGKRKAERGSGRLCSSWCKRPRLAISLLHRRAGQLSCARRSDFGVCQGARKIRRDSCLDSFHRQLSRPPQHYTTGPHHRAFDVFQSSCYREREDSKM